MGPGGKRYKTVLGYKRGGGFGGAAVAVIRNRYPRAARIKGAIRPSGLTELKFVDLASATYACDTTGSVTALNLIAVGDDNTTRDGRQVTIKSVQIRGILQPQDSTTTTNKARIILVWDNAVNSGAIATIAEIFTASTANSFPLVNNQNRFTILWDQSFACGAIDSTATQALAFSPAVHNVDYYRKLGSVTQYSGTTAAIGSIQNGGLLMVTLGTQAAAAGTNFIAATRVRFVDD